MLPGQHSTPNSATGTAVLPSWDPWKTGNVLYGPCDPVRLRDLQLPVSKLCPLRTRLSTFSQI